MISITIPLRTVSETNMREHWKARHGRRKNQRHSVYWHLYSAMGSTYSFHNGDRRVVTLTRVAPRPLDSDNLQGALKATRDAVADWMRVDDADERIEWRYGQIRGQPKEYAVRIKVS